MVYLWYMGKNALKGATVGMDTQIKCTSIHLEKHHKKIKT